MRRLEFLAGKTLNLFDNSGAVAELIMLLNSIQALAPYKASDDLMPELVNVTAIIKDNREGAGAASCRVEIVEPHNLGIQQPPERVHARQSAGSNVQMPCTKSAGVGLGDTK